MNSFHLSIPPQRQINTVTSADINNLAAISCLLLLFLGLPLIATLFGRHIRHKTKQLNIQRQMLERIWRTRSGKPQI
jgi:ACR3 family arsenite efflux pump ArsB